MRKMTPTTAAQASALCASAMLRGARGNSGVILSLIFRGFSRAMKDKDTMDGIDLADALNAGVVAAYKAVMKPAEGTVLTVSRLAGDRAGRAAEENTAFEYVLGSALERAREALADTVNQNPVLKKAGVVDAGGMGFVVILQGMLDELHGIPAPADDQERSSSATVQSSSVPGTPKKIPRHCGPSSMDWGTAWCWWTTMRSSRYMSTPTIQAKSWRRPSPTAAF